MIYRKLSYFDQFTCIAGDCPDTCCGGWQIVIDEDSLERYRKMKGEFAERLKTSIDWEDASYKQKENRRCSLLNDRNLCDQVLALGEESLCKTCHLFPRHVEEFEGLREWSLSMSCPEAARIVLLSEKPFKILEEEDDKEDPLEEEFDDFDYFLFTQLQDARKKLLALAQDQSIPLDERMDRILSLAADMQKCLDEDRIGDIAECGTEAEGTEAEGAEADAAVNFKYKCSKAQADYRLLTELERLNDSWTEILDLEKKALQHSEENPEQKQFNPEHDIHRENLLVNLLFLWFCGAVYDNCIYSKVALSVFIVRVSDEMTRVRIAERDKIGLNGGIRNGNSYGNRTETKFDEQYADIPENERIWLDTVRKLLREVEHSDENLLHLEEKFMENFDKLDKS